jgi:serine protease
MRIVAALLLTVAMAVTAHGQSREYDGRVRRAGPSSTTDQIIVKWREGATGSSAVSRTQKLSSFAGVRLQPKGQIAQKMDVLKLERRLDKEELEEVLAQIARNPDVEYAVPDHRRYAHRVPSDTLFLEQWYFRTGEIAATRAELAWDETTGSTATVVAVLDTGVLFDHPDLQGKLLNGYDFVSNLAIANDGDGIDADPSDPGDWISASDRGQVEFADCEESDSSWHGTRVASLIAAVTDEGLGMAGAGWSTRILPVRVLGKCGGADSDILAAMRWAAGLPVPGVPANTTPAKVINLSLGGEGACTAAYRSAIAEITAQGTLIVASAGNESSVISTPANCPGVIAVTGLRHAGTKVGFSNLGPEADLGAPAGNCVNTSATLPCLFQITVATNTGTTDPLSPSWSSQDQANANYGTSFSAPLVAGAAALLHAMRPDLTPSQYGALLKETAAPFPTSSSTATGVCQVPTSPFHIQEMECICTKQTCGAGMLDTHAAVLATLQPLAVIEAVDTINTGVDVSIDGRSSFAPANGTITSYHWTLLNVVGATPTIAAPEEPLTTLQVSGASQFTLRLTVVDDQGRSDSSDLRMSTAAVSPPPDVTPDPGPPLPSGSGGGGGGSLSWLALALGTLAVLAAKRRGSRAA